jgi:hypothetical protein
MSPRAIAVVSLALLVAACAPTTTRTTFPPLGSSPRPAGAATGAATQQVISALAGAGLQAVDSVRANRPPEGALLAAAPRTVLEVQLLDDPEPNVIVLYALGSPEAAVAAAKDHAEFLRSPTGGINRPPGTRYVIQVVGSTVIFFDWLPASSPDPGTATIAQTLATLGEAIPVAP